MIFLKKKHNKSNPNRTPCLLGYVTCILDDSKVYANHAKKKFIDLEDVRLAVKMQLERTFTNPPPRDVLLDVARAKNNIPLPFVKPNNGLRLPPDRYCLAGTNYKLKNSTKKAVGKAMHSIVGNNMSTGQPRLKVEGNKGNMSIVKRPGTLATIARTQTISIPKPVVKFTSGKCTSPVYYIIKKDNFHLTHPSDPLKFIYPRSNLSSSIDPDRPICRILCNLNRYPRTKYCMNQIPDKQFNLT